jgi:hypothetical protein
MDLNAYRELIVDLHESTFAGSQDAVYNHSYDSVIQTLDTDLNQNAVQKSVDNYLSQVEQKSQDLPAWMSQEINSSLKDIRLASQQLSFDEASISKGDDLNELLQVAGIQSNSSFEANINPAQHDVPQASPTVMQDGPVTNIKTFKPHAQTQDISEDALTLQNLADLPPLDIIKGQDVDDRELTFANHDRQPDRARQIPVDYNLDF